MQENPCRFIPSWDEYHMSYAELAATKSKDSTQVGAVLITPDRVPLISSYNGPAIGVADLADRFERPRKYLFASHAEVNVIAFAAKNGIRTDGCGLFVTHSPCAACARTAINAGIRCIVYGEGVYGGQDEQWEAAEPQLKEAGIVYRQFRKYPDASKLHVTIRATS